MPSHFHRVSQSRLISPLSAFQPLLFLPMHAIGLLPGRESSYCQYSFSILLRLPNSGIGDW